jgi:hypothetical protein
MDCPIVCWTNKLLSHLFSSSLMFPLAESVVRTPEPSHSISSPASELYKDVKAYSPAVRAPECALEARRLQAPSQALPQEPQDLKEPLFFSLVSLSTVKISCFPLQSSPRHDRIFLQVLFLSSTSPYCIRSSLPVVPAMIIPCYGIIKLHLFPSLRVSHPFVATYFTYLV